MKRFFFLLCAVLTLFLFISCGKVEAYEPNFSCIQPFSYENGKITGTVYTLDTLHLRELVETEDDLLLTADFSADYYSEDGEIPLQEGTNEMVLTFMSEDGEAKIPVIIEVILLKDLRVEMLSAEKTYRIGEPFDKSLCHAWGAGPLYFIGRYLVGLVPTAIGYSSFEISPRLDCGNYKAVIPVMNGKVCVEVKDGGLTAFSNISGGIIKAKGKIIELKINDTVTL